MDPFWTPEAQDRANIFDYIEAGNPVAALDLDEALEEKVGCRSINQA
ncbi:type II toxin-antitoxin system RelE/ParE family toxin [Burkholderia vietnamiensis]|nr:type II toxin-antitoxin system RelE/ParE family toxin [Burkholderia vietnamiensis]